MTGPAPGTAEVVRFDLLGPPVLSRSAVLRDEKLRTDTARQRAGWPTARRVVVVADHTKWGTTGLSSFASLDEVDTLVMDAGLAAADREEIAEQFAELIIAGPDAGGHGG